MDNLVSALSYHGLRNRKLQYESAKNGEKKQWFISRAKPYISEEVPGMKRKVSTSILEHSAKGLIAMLKKRITRQYHISELAAAVCALKHCFSNRTRAACQRYQNPICTFQHAMPTVLCSALCVLNWPRTSAYIMQHAMQTLLCSALCVLNWLRTSAYIMQHAMQTVLCSALCVLNWPR
jgi:hypothetical protein